MKQTDAPRYRRNDLKVGTDENIQASSDDTFRIGSVKCLTDDPSHSVVHTDTPLLFTSSLLPQLRTL